MSLGGLKLQTTRRTNKPIALPFLFYQCQLFFSYFDMFNYIREIVCYCQMIEWEKGIKEI